jgi:hypothetical protein
LVDHHRLHLLGTLLVADFEAWLGAVDSDASTEGIQPYRDPSDRPILTLADTRWFGPSETWPRELPNYPYIEFWHRLDDALERQAVPGMGPELLGEEAWRGLFSPGALRENPGISLRLWTERALTARRRDVDQLGTSRPAGQPADVGAVETR